MSAPAPRSGYELAAKILETHPEDAIETLLKYGNGAECDWLEFKAGMTLLPENKEKGERLDDLYWDYLLSIVAMANTRGGAFVIGVHDKTHKPVPLDSCDPRHVIEKEGKEAYLRKEVIDRLDRPERKWTTKDGTVWSLPESIAPFLDKRIMPYKGTDVIVLLVPPQKLGEEFFVVSKSNLGEFEHLPVRDMGEVGHVKRLTKDREFATHRANREQQLFTSQLGVWWDELDSEASAIVNESSLDEKILSFATELNHARSQPLENYVELTAALCEIPKYSSGEELPSTSQPLFQSDELSEEDTFDLAARQTDPADTIDEFDNDSIRIVPNSERPLLALLEEYPRIALIGEPGQGKSTGLQKFAVTKMMTAGDYRSLYLYIELGRWHDGGSVEALIRSVVSLTEFEFLRKSQRIHLILDALNECADNLKPGAKCSILSFLNDYPDLPVVITARKPEDIKEFNFKTYVVCPLDKDHQELYLAKRLNDHDKAVNLLARIYKQPNGASLASNPMLLRMVAEVATENDQAKLPVGRAKLYRTWTRQFFNRERKKEQFAKETLDFNTIEEAISYISRIAFIGRLNSGQRAVPASLVANLIAQRRGEKRSFVFQGPLLRLKYDSEQKSEYIHFLHETFQEYLCGERLLEDPNEASKLFGQDFSTWEMPLAYALELNGDKRVPQPLINILTKRSPWLAAVIKHIEKQDLASNSVEQFFTYAYNGSISSRTMIDMFQAGWYSQNDTTLTYTLATNAKLRKEWLIFEKNIFQTLFSPSFVREMEPELARKAFSRFFNSRIVLTFKDIESVPDAFAKRISKDSEFVCNILATEFITPDNISTQMHEKINRVKSKLSATQLLTYKRNRLIPEDEFLQRSRALIKRATLSDATLLVEQGIATPNEFICQARSWEQEAVGNVETARTMIHARLLDAQGLLEIFRALQMTPSPTWAHQAMECGLLTKQDLVQLAKPLLRTCRPTIDEMRLLNLVMREKTQTKLPSWLPSMPLKDIETLYKEKIISENSVQPIIEEFLSECGTPTPDEILALCALAPHAVQSNAIKWAHALDPADFATLFEAPVILPADFANEIHTILKTTRSFFKQPSVMRRLLCSGAIARDLPVPQEAVQSLDTVLDKMNDVLGNETPFGESGYEAKAVVIESTPRYAILKLMGGFRTALCLPSVLQERMMIRGDIWAITTSLTPNGYKVEQAELLTPSSWCGVNCQVEATCGKQSAVGLKMRAEGISHPVYWRRGLMGSVNPFSAKRWQIEVAPWFCRSKNRFLLAVLKAQAV